MPTIAATHDTVLTCHDHNCAMTGCCYPNDKPLPPLPSEASEESAELSSIIPQLNTPPPLPSVINSVDPLKCPISSLSSTTTSSSSSSSSPPFSSSTPPPFSKENHPPRTISSIPAKTFDQVSIATASSVTSSVRSASERLSGYLTNTAQATVEYLTPTLPPTAAAVEFVTRTGNTAAQYLSSQWPPPPPPPLLPRVFNGSRATTTTTTTTTTATTTGSLLESETKFRRNGRVSWDTKTFVCDGDTCPGDGCGCGCGCGGGGNGDSIRKKGITVHQEEARCHHYPTLRSQSMPMLVAAHHHGVPTTVTALSRARKGREEFPTIPKRVHQSLSSTSRSRSSSAANLFQTPSSSPAAIAPSISSSSSATTSSFPFFASNDKRDAESFRESRYHYCTSGNSRRCHSIRSTSSYSTIMTMGTTSTQSLLVPKTRQQRQRHRRHRPLQTIPGPEGLDTHLRQELELQDFNALGLRDGSEGDRWRNWWDARRYGIPRYIFFHEFRKPRICTVIVLVVVIVIIALPIGLKNT